MKSQEESSIGAERSAPNKIADYATRTSIRSFSSVIDSLNKPSTDCLDTRKQKRI